MAKLTKIKITDDRYGRTAGVGVNGRQHQIPTNTEVSVDEGVLDVLRGAGVAFEISGQEDSAENAVSTVRADPALSGGPKVQLGKVKKSDEPSTDEFRVDGTTIGSAPAGGAAVAAGVDGGITQDTGGAAAPNPGSRDTVASSEPAPAPAPRKRK